jgi:hypothetical protein
VRGGGGGGVACVPSDHGLLLCRHSDIAFAAGAVWTLDARGSLLRPAPSSGPSLAAAGDILWVVAGDGAITELDARTGRIFGRARGPALPLETSRRTGAGDSGLWISSPARREVVHIDARTRRVTRYPLGGDPGALAVVDGRIWAGTLHDTGTLTRVTVLDRDGRIAGTIPVPTQVVNIVPSPGGGAWASFGENDTVSPAALRVPGP